MAFSINDESIVIYTTNTIYVIEITPMMLCFLNYFSSKRYELIPAPNKSFHYALFCGTERILE